MDGMPAEGRRHGRVEGVRAVPITFEEGMTMLCRMGAAVVAALGLWASPAWAQFSDVKTLRLGDVPKMKLGEASTDADTLLVRGGSHGGGSHGGGSHGGGFHSGGFHSGGFHNGGFHSSGFRNVGFHNGGFHR